MIEALGVLYFHIVYEFVRLVVRILMLVFSLSFIARHKEGLLFLAYLSAAASGLHLLLGLTFSGLPGFREYTLSILFSAPVLLASLALLLISLASASAIGIAAMAKEEAGKTEISFDQSLSIGFVSFALVFSLILGMSSLASSQTSRASLRDRLCNHANGNISDTWKDRGAEALSLAERMVRIELSDGIPCKESTE